MQALAKLNEETPDLILLDITMPRMDGYQVCKVIKKNPYTKDIPVVMLSGKDGFFDKVKGKMAGATDYVTKPFREVTLTRAIERYLPVRGV
jgi:twitching motility two-component system response regulator PilG